MTIRKGALFSCVVAFCGLACQGQSTLIDDSRKLGSSRVPLTAPPKVPSLFEADSIPPNTDQAAFFSPTGLTVVDTFFGCSSMATREIVQKSGSLRA